MIEYLSQNADLALWAAAMAALLVWAVGIPVMQGRKKVAAATAKLDPKALEVEFERRRQELTERYTNVVEQIGITMAKAEAVICGEKLENLNWDKLEGDAKLWYDRAVARIALNERLEDKKAQVARRKSRTCRLGGI